MDSFFVEVERRDDPALVGIPVAVGGKGPRGVIASASYEAREFGVRSAQPTSVALRLCPNLTVVAPTHGRYSEVSNEVFACFRSFTPMVEGLSLDEAFLDVTGLRRHYRSSTEVGHGIRASLRSKLGLPASVGVAASKFIAKLGSEAAKPDGLHHVRSGDEIRFLHPLPADVLWGVGPATLAGLDQLGVTTVGDISELPVATLSTALGPTVGRHLHDLANGRDPRKVESDGDAKSVSVEQTYETDLTGLDVIESALLAHCQRLSNRLRRSGLVAKTVSLKLRYDDFTTVTRSQTFASGIDGARNLYKIGTHLLDQLDLSRPVRLIGLGGTGLEPVVQPTQLDFDSSPEWQRLESAIGEVRDRFGDEALSPARLIEVPDDPD